VRYQRCAPAFAEATAGKPAISIFINRSNTNNMAILEPLSYKQQKFCEEYLLSFNAYRAALTAGYTDNTARKGDLLHVPKIQAYLKDAMSRSAARAELTHDMLLRELMKIAFCSMGNYYDDRGDPKRMHQLTDDEKAAISYFQRADVTQDDGHISGEMFKIKLHNKMAAIDKLCRHTGFYKANWQPKVVIQPVVTEEDIAFEAESAKIEAGPYTEEVQNELLGQIGIVNESQESRAGEENQESRCKNQDEEEGEWPAVAKAMAGETSDDALQTSASVEDGKGKMEDVADMMEDVREKNLTLTPFEKTENLVQPAAESSGTVLGGRWVALCRPSLRVAVG
jgi:phage terminase small subunit